MAEAVTEPVAEAIAPIGEADAQTVQPVVEAITEPAPEDTAEALATDSENDEVKPA